MRALVLAGAPNRGKLAAAAPEMWEALIPIGGRPMVLYVLDALWAAGNVESVVLVGPSDLDSFLTGYQNTGGAAVGSADGLPWLVRIDPGVSLMENLRRGLEVLSSDRLLLVVTGDAVLLNGRVLRQFLSACWEAERQAGREFEVFYPVVTRKGMERVLPAGRRTYVQLLDGEFTGGNIFLMRPSVVEKAGRILEEAIAARKKPWRLARLFGWRFLLALARRRLRIASVEQVVADRFGISGKAIVLEEAAIGFDVDKPVDLAMARELLASSRGGGNAPAGATPRSSNL